MRDDSLELLGLVPTTTAFFSPPIDGVRDRSGGGDARNVQRTSNVHDDSSHHIPVGPADANGSSLSRIINRSLVRFNVIGSMVNNVR
jgi:hypothetical protein